MKENVEWTKNEIMRLIEEATEEQIDLVWRFLRAMLS